jgi:uncharacterized protein
MTEVSIVDMLIELANVKATPIRAEESFDPNDIDLAGEPGVLLDRPQLRAELDRTDSRVRLRGTLISDVQVDCARCLEPVIIHLDMPVKAIFVESEAIDTSPDVEVSDEQLDEAVVDDGVIDLGDLVREQILLALPEQIFCRADCKGLCPRCGENLNLINCKCVDDEIDPRWAALKGLK